jgi:hypothetical protein
LLDGLFAHPAGYHDTNRPLTLPAAYCAKIEFFRGLLEGTPDETLAEYELKNSAVEANRMTGQQIFPGLEKDDSRDLDLFAKAPIDVLSMPLIAHVLSHLADRDTKRPFSRPTDVYVP